MSDAINRGEGFGGLRVVSFESRRADDVRKLIQRLGGVPRVAPSMREIPLENQREVLRIAPRLFDHTIDLLILLTGVGTRMLIQALSKRYPLTEITQALRTIAILARGPKPVVALAEFGLKPALVVPEPNTWRDILTMIDERASVQGRRVAVQEYGITNPELLNGLEARGAEVIRLPVYRWALPADLEPLREALRTICDGETDVLLFTSATQIEHVVQIAKEMGLEPAWRQATQRCVIASVGPVCTEALRRHGFPVDLEPAHPKLGSLLSEASENSHAILQRKRSRSP